MQKLNGSNTQDCNKYGLTPRELEISTLISDGLANKEISQALDISIDTVKRHVLNLFNKVGVDSRMALALRLFPHKTIPLKNSVFGKLTESEKQVALCEISGLSPSETAAKLGCSCSSVTSLRKNVYRKSQTSTRAELQERIEHGGLLEFGFFRIEELTEKDKLIIKALKSGMNNGDIASYVIGTDEDNIKKHVSRMLDITGAANRTQMAFMELGEPPKKSRPLQALVKEARYNKDGSPRTWGDALREDQIRASQHASFPVGAGSDRSSR